MIFIAAALAVVLRFTALGRQPLWLDEASDAAFAARSLHDCILAEIVHPPLYRTLLHFVVVHFGNSATAVRFLPAVFGVLTVPAIVMLARRFWPQQDFVAATLAATSPFLLFYSQENRGYSLCILLTVLASWAFFRFRETGRGLALYGALCGLLIYTHYVAVFVLIAHEWIYWRFARRRTRDWILGRLAVAMAFAPWAAWVVAHYRPESRLFVPAASLIPTAILRFFMGYGIWASDANFREQSLRSRFLEQAPVVLPALSLFLWLLYRGARRIWRVPEMRDFFAAIIFIPWGVLVGFAPWMRLAHERYLSFQAPFILVLVAAGLATLRWRARLLTSLSLIVVIGFSLAAYYRAPATVLGYRFRYGKENWAGAAAFIRQQQADAVVVAPGYLSLALDRYPLGAAREIRADSNSAAPPDIQGHERVALVISHSDGAQERLAAALDRSYPRVAQTAFSSQNRIVVIVYDVSGSERTQGAVSFQRSAISR